MLDVIDDGEPIDGEPRQGIGLNNVRDRLEALHGDRFSLRLVPAETGGTRVTIDIPFVA